MNLIKTVAELKKYIPVAYTNSDARLPDFNRAEEKYLISILGYVLYQQLLTAYNANNLTTAEAKLLPYCQAVIAPFAYIHDLPFLQATLTNNGLQRTEAENSRGAFKWEYNKVIEGLESRGYSAQESLLLFLHANASDYPDWSSSAYNDSDEFKIIRNGKDLSSVISIGLQQPHRTFLLLKSIFNSLYELYLEDVLGRDYYTAFSARIASNTLAAEETELLKKLRMACARLAMKQASEQLSVKLGTDGGFTIREGTVDTEDEHSNKNDPGDGRIILFGKQMEESGLMLLQKCKDLLNGNASLSVFPEYFTSDKYEDPAAKAELPRRNENRKIFIA